MPAGRWIRTSGRLLAVGTRVVLTALVVVLLALVVRIGVDEWAHVGTGAVAGTAHSERCVEKNVETTTYVTCYGRFVTSSGVARAEEVRIDGVDVVGVTVPATTAASSSWVVEGTSPWRAVPGTFARVLPVGLAGIGVVGAVVLGLVTLAVGWVLVSLALTSAPGRRSR